MVFISIIFRMMNEIYIPTSLGDHCTSTIDHRFGFWLLQCNDPAPWSLGVMQQHKACTKGILFGGCKQTPTNPNHRSGIIPLHRSCHPPQHIRISWYVLSKRLATSTIRSSWLHQHDVYTMDSSTKRILIMSPRRRIKLNIPVDYKWKISNRES